MLLCLIQTWVPPPSSRPGWGVPHPDLVRWGVPPIIQNWSREGVPWVPPPSRPGMGYLPPEMGYPPDLRWDTPSPRPGMGYPPDLRQGTSYLDMGWGTPPPRPEMGYPPYPDLRWDTPLPRPGMGYPHTWTWDGVPPPTQTWDGVPPPQVWTKWKYNLPSSFGCGR